MGDNAIESFVTVPGVRRDERSHGEDDLCVAERDRLCRESIAVAIRLFGENTALKFRKAGSDD